LKDRISVVIRPSGVGYQAKCQPLHDDGELGENKAIEQLQNWPLRNLKKMLNSSFPKRYVDLKVLIKMDKFGRRSLVLVHMFS
jgi:hypothetical protein